MVRLAPTIPYYYWRMESLVTVPISRVDRDGALFQLRLLEVCENLAKSVVRDGGGGAAKFVEIRVKGARNREDAKRAAMPLPILRW